jgi:hypothetical protein
MRPAQDGDPAAAAPLDAGTAAPLAAANAGDAIAALTTVGEPATATADQSIALAFASATDMPETMSEADRAILTAFALVDASRGTVQDADAVLTAAASRRAIQETPAFALARTDAGAGTAAPAPAAFTGVVIGSDGMLSYADGDVDALADLIVDGAPVADAAASRTALAMPQPQGDVLVAPEAASDVADLDGDVGPPVDRFAPTEAAPAPVAPPATATASVQRGSDSGFFAKLFTSLVE